MSKLYLDLWGRGAADVRYCLFCSCIDTALLVTLDNNCISPEENTAQSSSPQRLL